MDSGLEDLKTQILALIDRKIAPLEEEVRAQSAIIARLTEQKTPKPVGKPGEEGKAKGIEVKSRPEDFKAKTEEAKKKAEEEKTKKLEAKKKAEESSRKKVEEEKPKSRKEVDDKRKKDLSFQGKRPAEEAKKPPRKAVRSVKSEVSEDGDQVSSVQNSSVEAVPGTDIKEPVLTLSGLEGSEEGEAIVTDRSTTEKETGEQKQEQRLLVVPEPALTDNFDGDNLLLSSHPSEQPAFSEEVLQRLSDVEDHSAERAAIDDEIYRLITAHGETTLGKTPPFQLSLGAKSAMSLLNTLDETQFYLNSVPSRDETIWVFRLFFQLRGKKLPAEKQEAWEECKQFLIAGREAGMERTVQEAVLNFDFSNENIDQVEQILSGKVEKINPNLYNQFCTLTGLIMFSVKEGLTYAGLIPEKATPWRKYQRLIYRRSKLS